MFTFEEELIAEVNNFNYYRACVLSNKISKYLANDKFTLPNLSPAEKVLWAALEAELMKREM